MFAPLQLRRHHSLWQRLGPASGKGADRPTKVWLVGSQAAVPLKERRRSFPSAPLASIHVQRRGAVIGQLLVCPGRQLNSRETIGPERQSEKERKKEREREGERDRIRRAEQQTATAVGIVHCPACRPLGRLDHLPWYTSPWAELRAAVAGRLPIPRGMCGRQRCC